VTLRRRRRSKRKKQLYELGSFMTAWMEECEGQLK